MKHILFIFFLCFLASISFAQVAKNLDLNVVNNKIVISYAMEGKIGNEYIVKISFQKETGEYMYPKNIIGDMGKVAGRGSKTITWDVLADGIELEGKIKPILEFELNDGGVVYWVDATGQHGLIADDHDLGKMNWEEAKRACEAKDNGWHLPTKEELQKLYENKDKVSGLKTASYSYYWSLSEYSTANAWYQYFVSGYLSYSSKDVAGYVRAVRAF